MLSALLQAQQEQTLKDASALQNNLNKQERETFEERKKKADMERLKDQQQKKASESEAEKGSSEKVNDSKNMKEGKSHSRKPKIVVLGPLDQRIKETYY